MVRLACIARKSRFESLVGSHTIKIKAMEKKRKRIRVTASKVDVVAIVMQMEHDEELRKIARVNWDNEEACYLVTPDSAREIPESEYLFFMKNKPSDWFLYKGPRWECRKIIRETHNLKIK